MAQWRGFSSKLQTPVDLLTKMEHDLARMNTDPNDPFAAFDFFVAAEHIVDWRYPTNADVATRKLIRSQDPMKTVSHLANGAKHFEAMAPHHTSVTAVERDRDDGHLLLMGVGRRVLMITMTNGNRVTAQRLAELVIAYWRKELGPGGRHEWH